jgi:hypothetical protein
VEPEGTRRGGLGAELDRIEAAVDGGRTDLRELGFWRLVGLIKRDDDAIERHADQVGRIDAKAFRAGVRFRLPVWLGNAVLLTQVLAGIVCAALAVAIASPAPNPVWSALLLVGAAGVWSVGVHSPTHWVVGRLVGIRFTDYFLGGPVPKRPSLKTDYASYLRAAPLARSTKTSDWKKVRRELAVARARRAR